MSEESTQNFPNENANLNQVVTEIRALSARLQGLEDKFDARSRETQPMSDRINQILSEVAATRQELREINRTLRRMNVDIATALRNQDDLEDRITTLETQLGQS
jgi:chromosome segregation ATPase